MEFDRLYPIKYEDVEDLVALQFKFMPSNIDRGIPGEVSLTDAKSVSVSLPNDNASIETFKGSVGDPRGQEFVLEFEDDEFKLFRLGTFGTNLRHIRNDEMFGATITSKPVDHTLPAKLKQAQPRKSIEGAGKARNKTEKSGSKIQSDHAGDDGNSHAGNTTSSKKSDIVGRLSKIMDASIERNSGRSDLDENPAAKRQKSGE